MLWSSGNVMVTTRVRNALSAATRRKKMPLTIACQGRKNFPRCHLASRSDPCTLRSACTLPDLDGVPPSRHTRFLSRAPSAVHLMHWFPPGSQPPGLSVGSTYTVISASTVCIWLRMLYHTTRTFVNSLWVFLYTQILPVQRRPLRQCPECKTSRTNYDDSCRGGS